VSRKLTIRLDMLTVVPTMLTVGADKATQMVNLSNQIADLLDKIIAF
jgi:hypothetical protein